MITGFSGAGKSQAMACFEDAGYFCVDNLPPEMIGQLAELFEHEGSKVERAAVVSDVRGGQFFDGLVKILDELVERGTAAPPALPGGHRGGAGQPLQGDPPAPSAGRARPATETAGRRAAGLAGDPRGADAAGAPARPRRRLHRHQSDLSASRLRKVVADKMLPRGSDRQAGRHLPHLRLQARGTARRRPPVRRPLPAQPPLRVGPAPPHGPRRARAGLRGVLGRDRRVLQAPRSPCSTTSCRSTSRRARPTSRSASAARAAATGRW